jgi:fatty acid-binding protein DegV
MINFTNNSPDLPVEERSEYLDGNNPHPTLQVLEIRQRINNGDRLVSADLLHVMPLLAVFPDGRVSIGGVLLGRSDLTAKFARFVRKRIARDKRWRLAVGHANAPAEAERLRRLIRQDLDNVDEGFIIPIGTALGVHGGPGCLVVAVQEDNA